MNNSNKNLLLPSQAREAKRINTQKLIFNHITYSYEKYRLFVEGVRFELTSPPYLRWRSTTELSSNVVLAIFTDCQYLSSSHIQNF